ncbi:MAG: DUF4417 domain-containing protein [Opitutales bacterium]|nr:DUF4417 domain-containing protein [Opitutales bacterium]
MRSFSFRNNQYFLKTGFETVGEYNFPLLRRQEVDITNLSLIPYHLTKPNDKKNKNCGVHFFIDDYHFSEVFEKPGIAFKRICDYKFLMTPDASLYREMPKWKLIENIGKSRYCGAYWQSKGKTIIPTISWAGLSTIDICTSAIEKGCVIAISTIGCQMSKFDFLVGYDRVIKTLEPATIICVGKTFKEMTGNIITVKYSRTRKIISEEKILENTDLHIGHELFLPFEEFN